MTFIQGGEGVFNTVHANNFHFFEELDVGDSARADQSA